MLFCIEVINFRLPLLKFWQIKLVLGNKFLNQLNL